MTQPTPSADMAPATISTPPETRKRILTLMAPYLPGYRSGGPVRSMSKMIETMQSRYEFYVLTNDRDFGDTGPYPGVAVGEWQRVRGANVYYAAKLDAATISRVMREIKPDVVYLHSYFDALARRVLTLRRLGRIPRIPIVLAPHGEFSKGALSLKATSKRWYRRVAHSAGLYRDLVWHACSDSENEDLMRELRGEPIFLARNAVFLTPEERERIGFPKPAKRNGHCQFIFAARVSPMKNLGHLLETLAAVSGDVQLAIFGPVEDRDRSFWEQCEAKLKMLPGNVKATYHGGVPHLEVLSALRAAHFFVLPTLGENFCQSIAEAFLCETPVVTSDRTPWRNLQRANVGFDIPLEDRAGWTRVLQRCVDMGPAEYEGSIGSIRTYMAALSVEESVRQMGIVFEHAMRSVQC